MNDLMSRIISAAANPESDNDACAKEVSIASDAKVDALLRLGAAQDALADHLETTVGQDRYNRWVNAWNRKARSLSDDVAHYQAAYNEVE